MTSERWWSFVQNLRDAGLARVAGDIVIDNSLFAPTDSSRAAFDAQPFRSYNVIPDALLVNFQTSRFTITPDPQGAQPRIAVTPLPANLVIDNQIRTIAGACSGQHRRVDFAVPSDARPNELAIRGTLAAKCSPLTIHRAIMTAPDYAYGTFRTLWSQSGGVVDGRLRLQQLPATATLIYEHDSLPLSEIVRLVNKYSNNVMARHVLLTLGVERFGRPAALEHGRNAVRAWLTEHGIEMRGLVIDNGSGLSRAERITARGLGEMLDVAWHSPFMPEFAASLPLSATDGTLRNRFNAPGMDGRIRLKTGRIDDVSALAGFVNAASGRTYVLVIIVNHPGAHGGAGEEVQAELIRWVFGQ
jgi:D-alanyl-D-alanine carboxypeptidase/D-alanyl-D-alanine-endopeptidase (penicillin-binding protein 4)